MIVMSHQPVASPTPYYYARFEDGVSTLMTKLGYVFNDPNLLKQALTHRSYNPKTSYERLEFLGDALLGMVIARSLFDRYPAHNEGSLTRMRATLVREETLVKIAERLELSAHLILGVGERKGGGRQRASILADSVEAIIGAIYLDSGHDGILLHERVLAWYGALIGDVGEEKVLKDAKSRLQELLQAQKIPLPNYTLIDTIGNAPKQIFMVECRVAVVDTQPIVETGESRRIAEQKCAERMINQLNKLPKLIATAPILSN